MYQLWSGIIPALAVVSLVGGVWSHYRRINCHVHRCWRIGRYDAGPYKVCHVHHPRDDVRARVTPQDVHTAYGHSEQGLKDAVKHVYGDQR